VELLARHPAARAWLSFTSPDGARPWHGEPHAECARDADGAPGVVAVGVNCVRPEVVGDAIRALRSGTDKPIVVYPNSGETWHAGNERWHGSAGDAGLAAFAPSWVAAGARLVGGCCRTGPRDIAALRNAL
jgi:homocysteine S-methyltransferase